MNAFANHLPESAPGTSLEPTRCVLQPPYGLSLRARQLQEALICHWSPSPFGRAAGSYTRSAPMPPVPDPSIELTSNVTLRALSAAAHVKR